VALIHGPPGTGKTRTLVEVIRRAAARGERILATAASNAAVDNLAERLAAAGVEVVRLGHPARVAPAVEELTLDARLERTGAWTLARRWNAEAASLRHRAAARRRRGGLTAEIREMLAEARRLARDARNELAREEERILSRARIICATAAGADAALAARAFDRVVLDEATQAVDPVALVALGRAPRAVLAGDPCQLPPTVIDPGAVATLGVTFFERIVRGAPGAAALLTVQHRMHADLQAFPSASMYGGRLVAAPEVAAHRLEDLGVAADPLRPGPLVFLDTAGKGWTDERAGDDPSTSNPGQAERVAAEVRRLLGRGLVPTDAAVITPYDAQVRLLRELLAAEVDAGLEVGTVDGFQGREKEAIVVDLVRSNDAGDIGFLADRRRMNVALTRARRFLLVVGDSGTLAGDAYYRAFLDAAERAWVSAWNDEAPPWA
jgi:predicted DNA helicase